MSKIDAVLFDLDGTLWDSAQSVANSWNEALKEVGVEKRLTKEDICGVMGLLMSQIADKLFPELDDKKRAEVLEKCCGVEIEYVAKHGGILFENLEKTLSELSKKYKLAIISNCQAGYIEAFFKAHNLSKYFCDYENPGRTGLQKGDNIKLVIERNNLKNAVYVGDTQGDFEASKIAGVDFIYAKYGFGNVVDYKYSIDSIDSLPEYLENMQNN